MGILDFEVDESVACGAFADHRIKAILDDCSQLYSCSNVHGVILPFVATNSSPKSNRRTRGNFIMFCATHSAA